MGVSIVFGGALLVWKNWLRENNVFWFVFVVKFLWELNPKRGLSTLELEWKENKIIKNLKKALLQ